MLVSDGERRRHFEDIAARKGVSIHFLDGNINRSDKIRNIHLDINIVEQVIKDAIIAVENSIMEKNNQARSILLLSDIKGKLERLLQSGSVYEKVTFAFSRGRYIFPEDVALLATSASRSSINTSESFPLDCETVCNFICTCFTDDNQVSQQFCENVCHDICSIKPFKNSE